MDVVEEMTVDMNLKTGIQIGKEMIPGLMIGEEVKVIKIKEDRKTMTGEENGDRKTMIKEENGDTN